MRAVVEQGFYAFNAPMEGEVPYFYQDVKGLVSIGVGLLADPVELALGLPMVYEDGVQASPIVIRDEWHRIKNLPPRADGLTAAQLGHLYAKPFTRLRLTRDGLVQTLVRKLQQMHGVLVQGFQDFEMWPADAQLGALSLAWACGPAYWNPAAGRGYFPKLTVALRACDFMTASAECFMPEEATISGLRPRNKANRILFQNAAVVAAQYLDPDRLYYPKDLTKATAVTEPPPASERGAPIVHAIPDMPPPPYDFDPDKG